MNAALLGPLTPAPSTRRGVCGSSQSSAIVLTRFVQRLAGTAVSPAADRPARRPDGRGRLPARRRRCLVARLLEQRDRPLGVARDVMRRRPRGRGAVARPRLRRPASVCSACSASSAAAAGAPRSCADRAASSSVAAISRSGSVVASARCRARSSAVGTIFARRACSARRAGRQLAGDDSGAEQRMGEPQALAVELEDPRGPSAPSRPALDTAPDRGLDERHRRIGERRNDLAHGLERVGAEAVEAGVQKLVEVRGNRELLARRERPPRRQSAPASSSAKNGLPREVSQSLISVGRGNVTSSRVRSSSCVAPMLSPPTSTSCSRPRARHDEARPARRRGPRAERRPAPRRGARARSEAPRATPRPATGASSTARQSGPSSARAATPRGTRRRPRGRRRGHPTLRAAAPPRAPAAEPDGSSARTSSATTRGDRSRPCEREARLGLRRSGRQDPGSRARPPQSSRPATASSSRSRPRPRRTTAPGSGLASRRGARREPRAARPCRRGADVVGATSSSIVRDARRIRASPRGAVAESSGRPSARTAARRHRCRSAAVGRSSSRGP